MEFDLDEWMRLAKRDPVAFEFRRKETIKQTIDQSRTEKRILEGLQFRLDMERRRSRNPMAACIRLYGMMMDYFDSEFRPVVESADKKRVMSPVVSDNKDSGEVIPFQMKSGKEERDE